MSQLIKNLKKLELVKDLVQNAINQGATTVEQIHQTVADLPFEILARTDVDAEELAQKRELNKQTIGSIYNAIRKINDEIGEFASDIFENLDDGQYINDVIERKYQELKDSLDTPEEQAPE